MRKCLIVLLVLALLLPSASALAAVTDPLANEPGVSPIVKEPGSVTLNLAMVQNVNVSSYDDNYLTKWVEDNTGIQLEFTLFPSTDANSKLDMLVASG
ncbi:MAG: hypothetical protein GX558_00020, partial [Clostridiales bacterium]|nr:hypothetical protein [Clostridiales bacterium]